MTRIEKGPLNDSELDKLADFLEDIDQHAMSMEMLDGFFSALICGPDVILPSEYLPQVFGENILFDSGEQATEILDLVMRHWNYIASTLLATLQKADLYFPVLLEDEEGVAHGNDWARGFMHGVKLRPESWYPLIGDDELGGPILPIMILAHEHDPDSKMRSPMIMPEQRDELLQSMIASLPYIYHYFEPHRRSAIQLPSGRRGPGVGRNQPCPCGSGRKYKRCCIDNQATVH